VLIALVILAIGVYAVLRIFPLGLQAIEASRQRTIAASLANAELERWKLLAGSGNMYSLPEAIIATDYEGRLIDMTDPGYPLGTLVPIQQEDMLNPGKAQAVPCWQPYSLWLTRTIIGERIIIPLPSVVSGDTTLSFYMLAFAPLDDLTTAELLQVCEADPFARSEDSVNPLTGRQYSVDCETGEFTFDDDYVDTGTPFSVTYSWIGTDGLVRTEIAEPRTIDASGDQFTVLAAGEALFQAMLPRSERVYLCYADSSPNPPDPGEFALDSTSLITGLLYFNSDDAGKEVRINYRTADWSILHEDHVIPDDREVQLSLPGVKGPTYRNSPRQPFPQPLPALAEGDNFVVAVNLGDPADYYADQNYPAGGQLSVDYRTGRITFPAGTQGQIVRIYYRARGDWAVQLRKPADSYAASSAWPPPYGYFFWDNRDQQLGESAEESDARLSTLFFTGLEAGASVVASYYDASRNYYSGELHTLSAQGRADAVPNLEYALESNGGALPDDALVSFLTLDVVPDQRSPIIIHGVSLTARTLWIGTGKSTVPAARTFSGNRPEYLNEAWRQAQITTFLSTPIR
jgi:hypothetical protein